MTLYPQSLLGKEEKKKIKFIILMILNYVVFQRNEQKVYLVESFFLF